MKKTVFLFLLISFFSTAQSLKSNLVKTVAAVNTILVKDKQVYFTDRKKNLFYLWKIDATINGDVFCLDSLTGNRVKGSGKMFNLLKVKIIDSDGNDIYLKGKNQKHIGTISNVRSENIRGLKRELDALQFICIRCSKLDPKFKCD